MNIHDADILDTGPERPPGRVNPRVAIAVVAAVAFVGWQLTRDQGKAHTPTPPEPSAAALPSPTPSPPDGRLPMGEPTAARLLLAARDAVTASVDDGASRAVPLPAGSVERALPVRSGTVLLIRANATTATAVFVPADGSAVRLIGPANEIIAAAADDSVWLAAEPAAIGVLSRYDLTKRTIVQRAELGPDRRAVRETRGGMITVFTKYFSSTLEVFDLSTRRVTKSFFAAENFVIQATEARRVAFTLPQCNRTACPVKVANILRGEVDEVPVPDGWVTESAAFTPDGTHLAVFGRMGGAPGVTGPAARSLLIADLVIGGVRQVDGIEAGGEALTLLTWTPDSDWLFAARRGRFDVLVGYRLGDRRARYAPYPQSFAVSGRLTALAAY